MDYSFINEMSTTTRHNHLVGSLFGDVFSLFRRKIAFPLLENCALVFYGDKEQGFEELVDVESIEDKDDFLANEIFELNFVQPDFLVFKDNGFLQDERKLRTAGVPDLIVEIWSKHNRKNERDMKFRIYSSSDKCEHWYIEQDGNLVTCFKGKQRLNDQSLERVLCTASGLAFDLTHMAL